MNKFTTLGEIRENIKVLETAVIQGLNANPPERVQQVLQEARGKLERCGELCEAPLRIALVGEFNSGKTLVLNSLLDCTDLFPCLLQPTTGNVLEARVTLKKEERPVNIKNIKVVFFNEVEIWEIMNYFLKSFSEDASLGLPKSVKSPDQLPKLEDALVSAYHKTHDISTQYGILAALEYLMSIKHNQAAVLREERHVCTIPKDLLGHALTLLGRPDLDLGVDAFYSALQQMHDAVGAVNINEGLNAKNIRCVFPLIRRIIVDLEAWCVPFGVKDPKDSNPLAFLDFPGLGAESSSARDRFLCTNEIRDAHSILVIFNGSNPGTVGAAAMASLFQQAGKLTAERTIISVNRFDEFQPVPGELNAQQYFSHVEEGTQVGFTSVLVPAKNLLASSTKQFKLYLCSAMAYLFEAKNKRGNWQFGKKEWFSDNKRQAAYSHYKRCEPEFKKLIGEVELNRGKLSGDYAIMKDALQRYLDAGGIPALRQDLIAFAREKGERLIKEDILKEFRAAYRLLDEVTPKTTGQQGERVAISSEVTYRAQEFYRVLELAVADALPNGPSEYKKLKIKDVEKDLHLWDIIETEITSQVAAWPEWFAILNQAQTKKAKPSTKSPEKPQRTFSRYSKLKKAGGDVPSEFKAFNARFEKTAEDLSQFALENIGKAIVYSVQRFEGHPDYSEACQALQGVLQVEKLSGMEEALPLLDAWQPTRMVEEAIVPEVLERVSDEVDELKNIRYPYDGDKPCFWNLALIIRVQVQLVKTLRDRVSRLIAASESQFQSFFVNEVLRAEILPLVRSCLNDTQFLANISSVEAEEQAVPWDAAGSSVRSSLDNVRQKSSLLGGTSGYTPQSSPNTPPKASPKTLAQDVPEDDGAEEIEEPEEGFGEEEHDEEKGQRRGDNKKNEEEGEFEEW